MPVPSTDADGGRELDMSKAESNKKWADGHRRLISSYNKEYYEQRAAELRERRKEKYNSDPEYRARALERAKANRKKRQSLVEKKPVAKKQQQQSKRG
jgi:hypothetical protein